MKPNHQRFDVLASRPNGSLPIPFRSVTRRQSWKIAKKFAYVQIKLLK